MSVELEYESGFIRLYRCLINKPIWLKSSPEHKTILITLLSMANYKDNEWEWQGEKFIVKAGQFITSLDSVVRNSGKGISTQNVRTALEKFEKYNFLTNISTKTGRLITIVNWHLYQVELLKTNKEDNKELTKNQQRGNKEVTPNKNDNKDNKDKKVLKDIVNFNPIIENYSDNQDLIKTIHDFIKHRQLIKKPMKTENTLCLLLKTLDKIASTPEEKIERLEYSMVGGYPSVYDKSYKQAKTNDINKIQTKEEKQDGVMHGGELINFDKLLTGDR